MTLAARSNLLARLDLERLTLWLAPLLLALSAATVTTAYYEVHGPALHLLILLGLIWLAQRLRHKHPVAASATARVLSGVFLLYTLVAVLAAGRAGFDTDALNRLDHFSYFLAGAVLIPFLTAVRPQPALFWAAMGATALASGLYALWEVHTYSAAFEQTTGLVYRAGGSKGKQIPFGDIATLAAVSSTLAACVYLRTRPLVAGLFLGAALVGGYASLASGTRGAWIILPSAVVVIGLYLLQQFPAHRRRVIATLSALLLVGSTVALQSEQIRERIDIATSEVSAYLNGDGVQPGDSLGERFEMWRAAWMAFESHPWLGIGVGQLNAYFKEAAERGLISQAIVEFNDNEGHTHAHNDYIHTLATRGLIGLASLLALYLIPLGVFIRAAASGATPDARAVGYAGILSILAYMQFSLTDSILLMRITAGYFVLLITWLLAMTLTRQETEPA